MVNPRTIARLEARILERAAHCVEFELADPRIALVTLTRCELSKDLGHAKLFYSVLGSAAEQRSTQRALDDAAGFVQRQVGRVLETRRTPKIAWFFDESIQRAAEMDRKIREALRTDRSVNPSAHPEYDEHGSPEEAEEAATDPDLEADEIDAEYEEFLEDDDR
ncbi:MAG: 30S ribosome-binding factor RbfA [Planctomycetota bacterium]